MSDFLRDRRVVEVQGLLLLLKETEGIDRFLMNNGGWEGDVEAWLKKNAEPGGYFLDIGANFGWYSLLAARLLGASGRVLAYEPTEAVHLIRINAELNGMDNVIAVQAAMGLETQVERAGCFAYSYPQGGKPESSYGPQRTLFHKLDDLQRSSFTGHSGLVKIDVDGYEAEVIAGGLRFLAENRPKLALEVSTQVEQFEAAGHTTKLGCASILEHLSALDYTVSGAIPDTGSVNLFCEPR